MNDITIVYYTANKAKEPFAERVRHQLLRAAGSIPIISVSHEPMSLGQNICIGTQPRSIYLIYKQLLIGAKAASTPYIATAEDDVLYPAEHFREHRPAPDVFAYDTWKWALYTWSRPPVFSIKRRRTLTSLICHRDALIATLEERFTKYPDPSAIREHHWSEPGKYERHMGVSEVKTEMFDASVPQIVFNTPEALGFGHLGYRKKLGDNCTEVLEPWGSAEHVLRTFYE